MKARCGCGQAELSLRGAPKARMLCHCTICQKVNQAPMADVVFFRPRDVTVIGDVRYRRYQYVPVSLRRGFCADCQGLIVEHFGAGPLGMTVVPVARLEGDGALPEPSGHIFYHRRVSDVHDGLPKIEGEVQSQLFATRKLLPVIVGL